MEIPFTKLHGNGNDFIVIDEYSRTVIPDGMEGQFAAIYCDRRFGIGADGVIYLSKTVKGNLRMRIFQPDESEAEMCGNGIRCLAKFAFDAGYAKESCTVETLAGEIGVVMGYREEDFFATINMTAPLFERKDIPATGSGEYKERIGDHVVYAVNTGVPHAVILVDSVDAIDLETVAPGIRNHASFLKGANVNFVEKTGDDSIRIRTFERGVEGETLSCGTGATASAAVVHKLGILGPVINVETSGGSLTIRMNGSTTMEGPARTVFSGVIPF
ncbi:diaminopimelate epimerase [uncultured Methanoregula sp.]|uniref:diaminopimelate epimerase n=1 Tax=uncultured Methanoregula sp. TaxID=1005933 RepID=UPI002AAAD450|nr:diaminopimelate epimerase [uncultured Methanoregula sp.]